MRRDVTVPNHLGNIRSVVNLLQKGGFTTRPLDQEEALGCVVVRAMGLEPLFNNYERVIGKHVNNALTPLNTKLKTPKEEWRTQ